MMQDDSSGGERSLRGRILVIDDEPLICEVIRMMLEDQHEVATTGSAREAKDVLGGDPNFDVILCDLMMRPESGKDLYHWLETTHPGLHERMVFMTGGAFTKEARSFLDSVPNRVINKPLEWSALDEAVRAVMSAES